MAAAAPSAGKEAFSGKEQQREGAIASGSGLGQTWHRRLCLQEVHCPVRETPHVALLVKEIAGYDQDWKSSAAQELEGTPEPKGGGTCKRAARSTHRMRRQALTATRGSEKSWGSLSDACLQ